MIGLDTSALIDIFKGDLAIRKVLSKNKEPLATTGLNYLELMFGIDFDDKDHKLEEDYYNEFFETLLNFNISKKASKMASKILWSLKKEGRIIEQFDCAISAILLVNGVNKIITRNVKHFEKIEGLKVISY